MKTIALLFLLAGSAAPAWCEEAAKPVTATVKAAFLEVRKSDFIVTRKETHLHLLWDAFPYAAQIKARAELKKKKASDLRKEVALSLVQLTLKAGGEKPKAIKVDVVEFPERDEYGAPRWGSIKKLERFGVKQGPKGTLKAEKAK